MSDEHQHSDGGGHPVSLERIQWMQSSLEEIDRRNAARIEGIHAEMTILKEFDTHRFDIKQGLIEGLDERLTATIVANDTRYKERWEAQQALMAESDKRLQQRYDAQQQALQEALIAHEKASLTAMASADRAVAKAEAASEKRFDSVNEFRATLADQASGLMPRGEAEAKLASINDRLVELTRLSERNEGKGLGQAGVLAILFGGVAAIVSVAGLLIGILKP